MRRSLTKLSRHYSLAAPPETSTRGGEVRLSGHESRDDQGESEADKATGQDRQLETGDHGVAATSSRVWRKRGSGLPVAMLRIQIKVAT